MKPTSERKGRGKHRATKVRRRPPRALGAIAGQFSQAGGSFALQLVAARTLGIEAFGVFAILLGAIVVATGIMTGVVGDSLTVLDRADRRIRGGLQIWCLVIAVLTCIVGVVVAWQTGQVSTKVAFLFGVAMAAWVVEDTARRLLMAAMRFWSVVAVDLTHATTALAFLWLVSRTRPLTLADLVLALVVSQTMALIVGFGRAPSRERVLGSWRRPALLAVVQFGAWRGIQQGIRPMTLTVARLLIAVVAGSAAVGQLEAARVYMAPALLFVQGIGSFLLTTYAADRAAPLTATLRKADKAAAALLVTSLGMGVVATLLVGPLGRIVSGSAYKIDPVAVAGWALFATSVAAVMPYASLAAVRGRQVVVVLLRLIDASLSVAATAVALFLIGAAPSVVPYTIAAGAFVGAVLQRTLVARTAVRLRRPPSPGTEDPLAVESA